MVSVLPELREVGHFTRSSWHGLERMATPLEALAAWREGVGGLAERVLTQTLGKKPPCSVLHPEPAEVQPAASMAFHAF